MEDKVSGYLHNALMLHPQKRIKSQLHLHTYRRRYGKYKPLKQPAQCTRCAEKRVKSSYHILCDVCVKETGVCAKCRAGDQEIVNAPQSSREEELRLQEELQREVKHLPERKRRTFIRYLAKKEKGQIYEITTLA